MVGGAARVVKLVSFNALVVWGARDPASAKPPGCTPEIEEMYENCSKDANNYFNNDECKEARRACEWSEDTKYCPVLGEPPAWWFMEPGWFRFKPDWLTIDHSQDPEPNFVQVDEAGEAAPGGAPPLALQVEEGGEQGEAAGDGDGRASNLLEVSSVVDPLNDILGRQEEDTRHLETAVRAARQRFSELKQRIKGQEGELDLEKELDIPSFLKNLLQMQQMLEKMTVGVA